MLKRFSKVKADINRIKRMGTVVWEGTLKSMPKKLKKPGRTYKTVRIHDIFGKTGSVVVELKRKKKR